MPCPFLREGRARYCHAAPVRKLILDGPGASEGGRCASARYVVVRTGGQSKTPRDRCSSFGRHSGWSTAASLRFRNRCHSVIFWESSNLRQQHYRYCYLYLQLDNCTRLCR